MSRTNVTFSVDSEIAERFRKEYENQSKKIEQLMENAVLGTSKREELQNELQELEEKKKDLDHRIGLIENRLGNLQSEEKRKKNLERFFSNESEKFERGYPQKWSSFDEFWKDLGSGIVNKFENKGFDPGEENLKEQIEKRIDEE